MRIVFEGGSETAVNGERMGFHGAVAAEHYLSAQAGMDVLKAGGNAFDAAAAAAFVESLVNPHMFTVGGECPMLLYSVKEGGVVAVNGNTEAPQAATLDAFRERGLDLIPPRGVDAAGTPAAVAALLDMLARYGSLPLEAVTRPALELARSGFPVHAGLLGLPKFGIAENAETFRNRWPASASLYLRRDGSVPEVGDRMANPAYADFLDTLNQAARRAGKTGFQAARDVFYRGDAAREIERFVRLRNGFLSASDLLRYETRFETPVSATFRESTVYKCGPWSQGPVFLQILRLLDGFDLRSMGHNSADYLHLWVEAAKLAFADREQYYADPRFVRVPLDELLDPSYADLRRRLIDPGRAARDHRPGDPRGPATLLSPEKVFLWKRWGYGTVHVDVIDRQGNMAALTPSGGWISGNEVVPSLGFPLGTRIQTFYLDAHHPNAPAPGKRPRTTLSPSLAFLKGRPWMVFGTMGGDQQDQWTSQFFLNRLVFGMSLREAVEAPKVSSDHFPGTFHPHEAFPARVRVESRVGDAVIEELRQRGHEVIVEPPWRLGFVCAVERHADGLLEACADPRGHRVPAFPACALAW